MTGAVSAANLLQPTNHADHTNERRLDSCGANADKNILSAPSSTSRGVGISSNMIRTVLSLIGLTMAVSASGTAADIVINRNFEGASLGTVEKLGDARFRLHVAGQYD